MVRQWLDPGHRATFLVLLGAALVSVALTIGVLSQGPAASARQAAPEPVGSTPRAATGSYGTFKGVAGPACPVDGTRGTRSSNGWQVVPGDSWTGDGCGDRFLYTTPDEPNYLQWQFTFDAPAARTCEIEVFVPDSPLASATVWYGVGDRLDNAEYRIGGFALDQKADRGQWARAATIPVGTSTLMINVNGDDGLTGVAAGPLRVSCAG
jgi:hypothetical protein